MAIATEAEVKERKDRVDDATHATRAAVEEGAVAGGGVALLDGIKALAELRLENDETDEEARQCNSPTHLRHCSTFSRPWTR